MTPVLRLDACGGSCRRNSGCHYAKDISDYRRSADPSIHGRFDIPRNGSIDTRPRHVNWSPAAKDAIIPRKRMALWGSIRASENGWFVDGSHVDRLVGKITRTLACHGASACHRGTSVKRDVRQETVQLDLECREKCAKSKRLELCVLSHLLTLIGLPASDLHQAHGADGFLTRL